MKRILLVEDDCSLGETLMERLRLEGYATDWVRTQKEALSIVSAQKYDLFILDVNLPDGSGFEIAKNIGAQAKIPFIFLTAMASAEYRLHGYELGAVEYIPKPFHLRELFLRVAHVLEEHTNRVVGEIQVGDCRVNFGSMTVELPNGKKDFLAKRECELLQLLVQNSPEVVSRDEILQKVWGADKYPSNRTVDNIIVRIRSAINDNGGKHIRTVRGIGYQFLNEAEET